VALVIGSAAAHRIRLMVRSRMMDRIYRQRAGTTLLQVSAGLRAFSRVCRLLFSLLLAGWREWVVTR
jgi:hypothetical protein